MRECIQVYVKTDAQRLNGPRMRELASRDGQHLRRSGFVAFCEGVRRAVTAVLQDAFRYGGLRFGVK